MEFSPLQYTGKVGIKVFVTDLLWTHIMKVSYVICVADIHDLCLDCVAKSA